jgi:hypothetical protein
LPVWLNILLCLALAIGALFLLLANMAMILPLFILFLFVVGVLGAAGVGWIINAVWLERPD